jgi:hypothetical protein
MALSLPLTSLLCTGGRSSEVLVAYGELHESLQARGYTSWRDYVLRQLFWGKQSTFAASAASGLLDPGLNSPIHKVLPQYLT